jgi:hypothetical protein
LTPQELVASLRQQHGAVTAHELAGRLGVEIRHAAWHVAQFAECSRHPKQITINDWAVDRLTVGQVNNLPHNQIIEVIIAHELFHLLTPAPSVWAKHADTENAAHEFAQRWTGLPFHPTEYEKILWATISA